MASFDEIMRISRERSGAAKEPPKDSKAAAEIPITLLKDFPNHKFPLYSGQRLDDMADSIKHYGILEPLVIQKKADEYIILSGHNRKQAAVLCGLDKVPCVVLENITDDEAAIIVGETNLRQRSFTDMSYSQRAFCLYEHYAALKKQGSRTDLIEQIENPEICDNNAENGTSANGCTRRKNSRDELSEKYNLSTFSISQYVRIATLNEDLLLMLDDNVISLKGAYQISFIGSSAAQQQISDALKATGKKLSPAKGEALRKLWEKKHSMTDSEIADIINGAKKEKIKAAVLKPNVLKKYFPKDTPTQEIIAKIVELLEADRKKGESNAEIQ